MRNTLLDKRIPTMLGITLILIGLTVTSYLARTGVITIGQASPSLTPTGVRITNISQNSFTVSYKTQDPTSGIVAYGTSQTLGETAGDDRDPAGTINSYNMHHISIKNLQPGTKYYFSIASSDIKFYNNNLPFEVTTGQNLDSQSENKLSGKIIFPDGTTDNEAIVYVKTEGAQSLSVISQKDGIYQLDISLLRNEDLSSYFPIADKTLQVLIVGLNAESLVNILASQANNVPTIVLSNNYDFTVGNNPLSTPVSSPSVGFPVISTASSSAEKTPDITLPKKNQSFSDQQPLFSGTASPGAEVNIIIHSDEQIQTKVQASNNGVWSYRPITPLTPGQHNLTITTKDQFGILKTVTQSFTVFAQGSQVSQSATPSATVRPTPTTVPTNIPTLIPAPTLIAVAPTIFVAPTVFIPAPTPLPLIFPTSLPPQPTIPASGSSVPPLIGFAALSLITLGILLYLSGGKIL